MGFLFRRLILASFVQVVFCYWLVPQCVAGGGPENVLLVVNANSHDSRTIANHYIDLRKIPPGNVLYLRHPVGRPAIPSTAFKTRILKPVLKAIADRKLQDQIDYVVYSSDFPWRVDFRKEFADSQFSKSNTPVASLTSATYFYAFVEQKRKEMFSLDANFYSSPANSLIVISRACRSSYRWSLGGRRAGAGGLPYMLSAMLGVTGVPGNTVPEVAWYLKRSAEADGTAPKGTIYYAVNQTIRSKVRDKDFPEAVRQLQLAGVRGEVVQGYFPQYKQDIAGVSCGHSNLELAASQSRILPGAFCDNLTSAGGQFLPDKKQTNISEFLRLGAAGACGTVVEPTALPQKFPNHTLHVHYVHGCSLAESFYQSVAAPFQQILVGDPLCQPWANTPKVAAPGVTDGKIVRGTVELTPSATVKDAGVASFQLFVDGVAGPKCSPGGQIAWDTTQLPDGHHEIRIVATDNTPIETQGRWIGSVIVKNGTDAVQLTVDEASLESTTGMLNVTAASTSDAAITIVSNGVELDTIPAGENSLSVDKTKLGAGPVTLIAITKTEPALRSRPVRVVIAGK